MYEYIIKGGKKLEGETYVSGSKNASLLYWPHTKGKFKYLKYVQRSTFKFRAVLAKEEQITQCLSTMAISWS